MSGLVDSFATPPSTSSRVLGLAGIVGGVALLAAFIVEVPSGLGIVRMSLVLVGAMAIIAAVYRLEAPIAPTMAAVAAIAAFLANAAYLALTILAIGDKSPFGADLVIAYLGAGVALWLSNAAFGLVTLRLGVFSRSGALALAVGSVLALTGIDSIGLTSAANPTIFGPLSLAGVALTGIGWILLGLDVATRSRETLIESNAL
jgi:hypothetical protein